MAWLERFVLEKRSHKSKNSSTQSIFFGSFYNRCIRHWVKDLPNISSNCDPLVPLFSLWHRLCIRARLSWAEITGLNSVRMRSSRQLDSKGHNSFACTVISMIYLKLDIVEVGRKLSSCIGSIPGLGIGIVTDALYACRSPSLYHMLYSLSNSSTTPSLGGSSTLLFERHPSLVWHVSELRAARKSQTLNGAHYGDTSSLLKVGKSDSGCTSSCG